MSNGEITADNLGDKIFDASKSEFGAKFGLVKKYLKTESEKLAITLRMIIEGRATGEVTEEEAKILLNMQKLAAKAVLTAAEGMSLLAVESAINAALAVVKDFVNSKVGFPLL